MTTNIKQLFGQSPSSTALRDFSKSIPGSSIDTPTIKSYPDIVYYNYFAVGLSLQFVPTKGYKPSMGLSHSEIDETRLSLDALDFYNVPKIDPSDPKAKGTSARRSELAFSSYPGALSLFPVADLKDKEGKVLSRPSHFDVSSETTGKDFVQCFGEPDRKGGGVGPSSGSIGIWCEWSQDGLLVEFGGDEAKGPQAWERGKDAVWKVITAFMPKVRIFCLYNLEMVPKLALLVK